jgi:hypothetical protein
MNDHSNPNPPRAEPGDVALEALRKSRHDPELHDAVVATILETYLSPDELRTLAKMAGVKPPPFIKVFGAIRPPGMGY